MNASPPTRKLLVITWLTLVLCHFAILGSAYLNLKFVNTPLTVALVLFQMVLILLLFMEAKYGSRLIWLTAAAGFFWMAIQFTLTLGDYFTRQWH